ncbi:hypothetical protein FRB99_002748 [Tulasnella sp. 403]|nr:hypothetical protein FRB99_002748 [Tulasnella sp. 403]
MALNVVTDLSISAIVSIKLVRSRSGFNKTTDTAIRKLLALTWGAGIPPAISAALDMITFLTMEMNLVHVFFNMLTPRLYVFSVMYALNSRAHIRNMLSQTPPLESQELSKTAFRSRGFDPGMRSNDENSPGVPRITVETQTFIHSVSGTGMTSKGSVIVKTSDDVEGREVIVQAPMDSADNLV